MPSQRVEPTLPSLPAEAALSFLKDTKGTLTWSARDLCESLNINRREAEQVLAVLQAQGYAQPASAPGGKDQWLTTPAGETVSGAKPPRFTRERVEQSLIDLQTRIQQSNEDSHSPFRITSAVAFGDFLFKDRSRVQAADIGVTLARRGAPPDRGGHTRATKSRPERLAAPPAEPRSASEAQAERAFLRQLRAKSALLNLRPYADWMRLRSHRKLL